MDVFFVISGFVMLASTEGRDMTRGAFVRARLIRVVPLYWLFTLVYLALIFWGIDGRPVPRPNEVVKSLLFIPYRDSATGQANPVLEVGWTLSYELLFYVLFAATMRLRNIVQLVLLTAVFLALCMLRLRVGGDQGLGMRMTSPLQLEFVGGIMIAMLRDRLAKLSGLYAIALGLIALLALVKGLPSPRTLSYGLPALLIVSASVIAEPVFRTTIMAWPRMIGDASYSLYLSHGPVMAIMLFMLSAIGNKLILGVVLAIACLGTALVVHFLLGSPITRWLKSEMKVRPAQVAVTLD